MLGTPVLHPHVRTGTLEAALGCNHQVGWIRVQRLSDQFFTDIGTVRVSRVDDVDSQLDRATEYSHCFGAITWWSPHAFASNAHRAKPETIHVQVAANCQLHIHAISANRCFSKGIYPRDLFRKITRTRSQEFVTVALVFSRWIGACTSPY